MARTLSSADLGVYGGMYFFLPGNSDGASVMLSLGFVHSSPNNLNRAEKMHFKYHFTCFEKSFSTLYSTLMNRFHLIAKNMLIIVIFETLVQSTFDVCV